MRSTGNTVVVTCGVCAGDRFSASRLAHLMLNPREYGISTTQRIVAAYKKGGHYVFR